MTLTKKYPCYIIGGSKYYENILYWELKDNNKTTCFFKDKKPAKFVRSDDWEYLLKDGYLKKVTIEELALII